MSDHTRPPLPPIGGHAAVPAAAPTTAAIPAGLHTPVTPPPTTPPPATPAPARHDPLGPAAAAPGLPIPVLTEAAPTDGTRCVVTPVDRDGRLADRSTIRHLGWPAGQPVSLVVEAGPTVVVRPGGGHRVDPRGHLRIPLGVRQESRVTAGDRVLVVADARREELLLVPMATLYDMLTAYRRSPEREARP